MTAASRKVVYLNRHKSAKLPPINDDVFFHKGQLRVGSMLRNVGRLERGTTWEVIRIATHRPARISVSVRQPEKLNDTIYLRGPGNQRRVITFGSLSYSALWRLM
jgi:hypothetical protein